MAKRNKERTFTGKSNRPLVYELHGDNAGLLAELNQRAKQIIGNPPRVELNELMTPPEQWRIVVDFFTRSGPEQVADDVSAAVLWDMDEQVEPWPELVEAVRKMHDVLVSKSQSDKGRRRHAFHESLKPRARDLALEKKQECPRWSKSKIAEYVLETLAEENPRQKSALPQKRAVEEWLTGLFPVANRQTKS